MDIEFYTDANNNTPVENFLDTLSPKIKSKTLRTIGLLKSNGRNLGMPHSRHLRDGIFELRTQLGNNIDRILYFFYVGNRAILTNGFIKKTQETPKEEILLAIKYRTDYLRRH